MCVHMLMMCSVIFLLRDSSVDMIKNKIRAHKYLHGYAPTYLKNLINSLFRQDIPCVLTMIIGCFKR